MMEIPSTFFTNIINTLIGFEGQSSNISKVFLMLFGTFITFLFHYMFDNVNHLYSMFGNFYTFINTYGSKKMILTVDVTDLQREYSVKASDASRAVLYYIDKNVHNIKNITTLKEYFMESFYSCGDYSQSKQNTQNIIDQESYIKINAHVSCKISFFIEEKEKYKNTRITIILFTPYNINVLKHFIERCQQEYKSDVNNKIHQNKYIFLLNSIGDNNELKYTQIPFTSTKTFDNMFFAQKDDLLSRIDYFMENRDTYNKVGMPYTLGFLFHGSPGTGKTSAIKAMANYMNRHVIIIPTQLVQDNDTLTNVFLSLRINNVDVPFEKRIYVFEEVDCGAWKDIVLQREYLDHSDGSISNANTNTNMNTNICRKGYAENTSICIVDNASSEKPILINAKPENKKQELKLANILEILDGIVETSGRVIVFTSNFPERLDKALLRPGRVNFKIEFTKMEKQHVNEMYKYWFGKNIRKDIYESMEDYKFSQAELGELFIQYRNNSDELQSRLV